ncbi:hypothetical protein QTP88_029271 [Uroleucon formosanum]
MENIFSNYDHAIEREQDKVFWPISLSNLNTANQITSFNIKKESNFLNIKKAKYQIFGRVLQSDSSDYPEKSIILLIDNFVGWLFKWIEVKIHGFFKDIEYPVYKGGFEIIFLRNSDDDALFRDRNEKNELAGVGKVIIDEFNIRIPIVTYDDMSKIKLINELTLLSKRNEYMFRFKSRNITDKLDNQLRDPIQFNNCNLKNIWIDIDSIRYPEELLNLDFKKEKFNIAYDMLMDYKHIYNRLHLNLSLMYLTPKKFKDTRPFFVINMSRQPPQISGSKPSIVLHADFNEDVPANIICYICLISGTEFYMILLII